MIEMVPKEQLIEERVDALAKKVDDGFARVDADIRELRGDMNALKYGLLSATVVILATILGTASFL